ncbi:neprilysin-2-like isoform X2 [Haemaphysalis longicornis]
MKTPRKRAPTETMDSTKMTRTTAMTVEATVTVLSKEEGTSKTITKVPSVPEQNQQKTWLQDKRREIIIIACSSLAATFVIVIVALFIVRVQSRPTVRICSSKDCLEHAGMLRAAMNRSANPCNDFYKFTCGSWKPRGAEKSMIGYVFAKAAQTAIGEMNTTDGALIPAAPTYFRSCLTKANTKTELDLFKSFKQGLGLMWPEAPERNQPHPLEALLNMSINWNYHVFFNLRAFPEYRKRPATLYIRRGRMRPDWQKISKDFGDVVKNHTAELGVDTKDDAKALRDVVEDIMKHAINVPPDATRDVEMTLDNMYTIMKYNSERLKTYLNDMLKPQFTWEGSSTVFLEDESILEQLDKLLKKYENKMTWLMRGLSWVFIRDNLWVVLGKPQLRYEDQDKDKLQQHLMRACLQYVESSFGLVVLAKDIYARYDDAMRKKLEVTFSRVREELIREVNNAEWIQRVIKEAIEHKVSDLGLNALPEPMFFSTDSLVDLYSSFSASVSGSFMRSYINLGKAYRSNLGTDRFVSIYSKRYYGNEPSRYNYYYNIAVLLLGALRSPILYSGGTLAMSFGSVGTLLAECMVRSFDKQGVTVDEKGEARKWWGDTYAGYKEQVRCPLVEGLEVSFGSIEQRERLQSAMFPVAPALTASFGAFREAVAARAGDGHIEDMRLSGLEDFSDEQIFFMTYCLMMCKVGGDGRECNWPVRHVPQFATAFYCRSGSAMNPYKKCRFLA